jgi:hypothetical protein
MLPVLGIGGPALNQSSVQDLSRYPSPKETERRNKMVKAISMGKCTLCQTNVDKKAMTKHLAKCRLAKRPVGQARPKAFHLLVEGHGLPEYWLHLEVSTQTTLEKLDSFLRDIWLECCGHLSAFRIGPTAYMSQPYEPDDKSMNIAVGNILSPKMEFYHEYDFGTTTELKLKVISEIEGLTREPIHLLARNEPPVIKCSLCGKTATQVCVECICADKGWLCEACAEKHECGEEMLLPVVNSPRVGMCGYTGD